MALPPLSVKIGADTDGLTKGLTGAQASIAKFAKVGAAGVAAVGTAMIALTKTSLANIDVMTKQARSLGLTAAAFQKMSLVAGEAGVETGKLSSMLGLMQRNIIELGQGTQAQVDAFGRLGLSMQDLQGLQPDQQFAKIAEALNGIVDPAEKTATAMDVFGRSGRDAINMLNGYGAAAANAAAFQERFGIAVAQDVAQGVERANDAVGRLGMVMTGLGNQMAGAVAPAIEATANRLIDFAAAIFGAETATERWDRKLNSLAGTLDPVVTEALRAAGDEAARFEPVLDRIVGNFDDIGDAVYGILTPLRDYAQALAASGARDQAAEIQKLTARMEALADSFDPATDSLDDFKEEILAIQTELVTMMTNLQNVDGVDFSNLVARVVSLGGVLKTAADNAANLVASLPGATVMQVGPSARRGTRAGTKGLAPTTSLRPRLPGVDFGEDPDATTGGGGGLTDAERLREQLATRLETLMEGLMTEREAVANWYAESQALLDEARAAELLTEQEYFDQKTRLQEEYNRRAQSLMNEEVQMRKSTFSSMIGLLTQFGSKNKALAKVAVALNAAQRVSEITANTAAASTRALAELGPIAGPPVAARIAAYGAMQKAIAVASAAMSARGSSGGGSFNSGSSSGSASSTQQAASAPQTMQTLNFSVTNDPFGISDRLVRQIVGAINQSQRDGSTIIRATVS